MTEQTNVNQSQVESEEFTTEVTETGFLLDLGNETANSYIHTGMINDVEVPIAIRIENVDEKLGKYSQVVGFSSISGMGMYLYGLVELEQEFKDKGVLDQLSEEEREILSIAFSANDYLKDAGVVSNNTADTAEAK
ncbi:hypothetical protein ACOMCU_01170 [Lysinibacillus sp. UGB7]|uniref:hypothetical protein n=1 Tax=Lysinibacillus sp. UGB7 TaxID=3411039 RepID=UPI003B7FB443